MCYALKASRDTVEAVYDAYPKAIKETDFWIGTPYHYAFAYEAPDEIVQFLLQKYPKGVEVVNYYGRTPLHMGALFRAPLRSMELIASKYPQATQIMDKDGYTPLHLACENACGSDNQNVRVIRAILESAGDNSICKSLDMLGHTPLHMALMGLAPYEVVELLVASCPETVWTKTTKGELPLEIAQRKRAPADVSELLERMMERLLVEQEK
eukprot:jgi/Psemu1/211089/e_gw1.554.7.1